MAQFQKVLHERDETLRRYEAQITEQCQQLREIVALKDRIGQLQIELAQVVQEKEEVLADLTTSRAMVQRLQTQAAPSSDITDNLEAAVASAPTPAASGWYQTWLAETTPEDRLTIDRARRGFLPF